MSFPAPQAGAAKCTLEGMFSGPPRALVSITRPRYHLLLATAIRERPAQACPSAGLLLDNPSTFRLIGQPRHPAQVAVITAGLAKPDDMKTYANMSVMLGKMMDRAIGLPPPDPAAAVTTIVDETFPPGKVSSVAAP